MREPTLEDIITARNKCAEIVTVFGEQYLPIFERLEKEITNRKSQKRLLEKALRIGTQNGTQIGTHLKLQFFRASK